MSIAPLFASELHYKILQDILVEIVMKGSSGVFGGWGSTSCSVNDGTNPTSWHLETSNLDLEYSVTHYVRHCSRAKPDATSNDARGTYLLNMSQTKHVAK